MEASVCYLYQKELKFSVAFIIPSYIVIYIVLQIKWLDVFDLFLTSLWIFYMKYSYFVKKVYIKNNKYYGFNHMLKLSFISNYFYDAWLALARRCRNLQQMHSTSQIYIRYMFSLCIISYVLPYLKFYFLSIKVYRPYFKINSWNKWKSYKRLHTIHHNKKKKTLS